jgi:DNA-binding MarR family transcriptional regulator
MATQRLSQLQKQILRWLWADEQRTHGGTSSSHHELLQALPGDKSNISRSLRTLEAHEWIVIERTAGGQAQALYLTPEGLKKASEICRKLSLRDKQCINSGL